MCKSEFIPGNLPGVLNDVSTKKTFKNVTTVKNILFWEVIICFSFPTAKILWNNMLRQQQINPEL